MTDRVTAIPFESGLNEVVSDSRAAAGDVRRSLNYAVQAEGGYEWIGGLAGWSGRDVTLNMDAIDVIELSKPGGTFGFPTVIIDAAVQGYRVGSLIIRPNTYLFVCQKFRATEQFTVGDLVLGAGATNSPVILDIEPELTDAEQQLVQQAITDFPDGRSTPPTGTDDVVLIHAMGDVVVAARMNGENEAALSRTTGAQVLITGSSAWANNYGTIAIPGDASLARWEAFAYTFAGSDPQLFIVTGASPPYVVERKSTGSDTAAVEIDDGVTEYPTHVIVHQDHLFLSYPKGRVLHSAVGTPTSFAVLGGAAELSAGAEITGFQILPGDSLGIFCENKIKILQGTSSADWTLQDYTNEAGAIVGTLQNMPTSIFADLRGISTLAASDTYGNFRDKTLTQNADSTYQKIRQGAKLYSGVSRSKSQYRLINQDGRGLYLTFKGSALVGVMEIDLGMPITAMGTFHSDEDRVFVASDGKIFQMDFPKVKVTDGAFIELVDHHYGSPRDKKRFSQIDLDIVGDQSVELTVSNLIDGGQDYYADGEPVEIDILTRSAETYRQSLVSRSSQRFEGTAYLCGSGVSQVIRIENTSTVPHSIKAALVHYRPRGQKR